MRTKQQPVNVRPGSGFLATLTAVGILGVSLPTLASQPNLKLLLRQQQQFFRERQDIQRLEQQQFDRQLFNYQRQQRLQQQQIQQQQQQIQQRHQRQQQQNQEENQQKLQQLQQQFQG